MTMGSKVISIAVLTTFPLISITASAVDAEAAKALARKNSCLACHGIDKDKLGPAFNKVSVKYKSIPAAEEKLVEHFTSGEPAKFPDGHTEPHFIIRNADTAALRNLADWILSL